MLLRVADKITDSGKIFPAVFFYWLLVSCSAQAGPGDSSLTKYPISDPRNPACACHDHQKLADKEYREIQELQIKREQQKVQPVQPGDHRPAKGYRKKHPWRQGYFKRGKHKPFHKKRQPLRDLFKRKVDACAKY